LNESVSDLLGFLVGHRGTLLKTSFPGGRNLG
jgi:hypothetical protein